MTDWLGRALLLEVCQRAYNKSWSQEHLYQTHANAYKISLVCAGHWPIGDRAARLGIPYNSHWCGEILTYFPCNCPVLARARLRTKGRPFFEDILEIPSFRVGELLFSWKSLAGSQDLRRLDSAPLSIRQRPWSKFIGGLRFSEKDRKVSKRYILLSFMYFQF